MKNEEIIQGLSQWVDFVFAHEEEFIEKFCKNANTLTEVSWDSENMRIVYILDSGQHVSNSFKINEWMRFLGDD